MTRPPRAEHLWATYDLPVLRAAAALTRTCPTIPARFLLPDTGLTHRHLHNALTRLHDAAYIEARDTGAFDHGYDTRDAIRITPAGHAAIAEEDALLGAALAAADARLAAALDDLTPAA